MNGFLLGLANGTVCIAYCSPVLIPYLLSEGNTVRFNYIYLGQFLVGRLIGYIIFGIVSWLASFLFFNQYIKSGLCFGSLYIIFAVMMFYYGFKSSHKNCSAKKMSSVMSLISDRIPVLVPLVFGLVTGLNLCPPFLLIFTESISKGNLLSSILFFVAFFVGTAVYFIPLPLLGLFSKNMHLKAVGKMASLIMSVYYLYIGINTIGGAL